MASIVVVGSSNTDMVVRVPTLPAPGETVLGGTFFQAAGGKGANQAVAAARAGGAVSFIACVGQDAFGEQALAGFEAEGIDITYVMQTKEAASGIALIVVDEAGENSIAVASGANAVLQPPAIEAAEAVFEGARVVLLQLESPLETVEAAAVRAARAGATVVLNPAPAQPLPASLLAQVSVLTPNRVEAEALSGHPLREAGDLHAVSQTLLAHGIEAVVVTMGADGAYVATQEGAEHIAGLSVQAVDTTGAGDAFNGALAVALAEGAALGEAVRFANAAAALSVTKPGAQPAAPQREEILARLGSR